MNAAEQFENITGTRFPEYPLALTHPAGESVHPCKRPAHLLGLGRPNAPRSLHVRSSSHGSHRASAHAARAAPSRPFSATQLPAPARPAHPPRAAPAEFYDTDQGPKSTLGKRVVESPRRYAVMRSTSPRFPDGKRDAVPFGVYNIDMGPKSGFSKSLEQSRCLASPVHVCACMAGSRQPCLRCDAPSECASL